MSSYTFSLAMRSHASNISIRGGGADGQDSYRSSPPPFPSRFNPSQVRPLPLSNPKQPPAGEGETLISSPPPNIPSTLLSFPSVRYTIKLPVNPTLPFSWDVTQSSVQLNHLYRTMNKYADFISEEQSRPDLTSMMQQLQDIQQFMRQEEST